MVLKTISILPGTQNLDISTIQKLIILQMVTKRKLDFRTAIKKKN